MGWGIPEAGRHGEGGSHQPLPPWNASFLNLERRRISGGHGWHPRHPRLQRSYGDVILACHRLSPLGPCRYGEIAAAACSSISTPSPGLVAVVERWACDCQLPSQSVQSTTSPRTVCRGHHCASCERDLSIRRPEVSWSKKLALNNMPCGLNGSYQPAQLNPNPHKKGTCGSR